MIRAALSSPALAEPRRRFSRKNNRHKTCAQQVSVGGVVSDEKE
jgi:hypothetical protein